jgi:hypothetical protein
LSTVEILCQFGREEDVLAIAATPLCDLLKFHFMSDQATNRLDRPEWMY